MMRGERERERERERASSCRMEESKGLPCQVPSTNVSKGFKFRVNVDRVFMDSIDVCARIFI